MKQLDTGTVLEIIRMIDAKIKHVEHMYMEEYIELGTKPLKDLGDHLQEYIEGQLNAFENQSPEQ